MSSTQDDNKPNTKRVRLPQPDPANITVLIHSAPNTPIFPWNHYDSPWLEAEAKNSEQSQSEKTTQ